jgi:hypothetical protein
MNILQTILYIRETIREFFSKDVPNYRKDMDKVWEENPMNLGRISAFGKVNKRERYDNKSSGD